MRARLACTLCAVVMLSLVPAMAGAQADRTPAIARARALNEGGASAEARSLVDSILADTDPGAPAYAEALYWRGAFNPDFTTARLDLLRLAVEYPFAPRTGDALLRLAQGALAAGDASMARRHLERLVRDHAAGEAGPRGAFELGKLLMGDGDVRPACAAFDSALAYEPAGNVEARNQIAYARRPCERLTAAVAEPPAPTQPVPVASRPSSPAAAVPAATRWSVQVGAFASRADANALAARLKARGYETRVTGTQPFRVRIGRFTSRAGATAVADKLKAEKIDAIVVEAERP